MTFSRKGEKGGGRNGRTGKMKSKSKTGGETGFMGIYFSSYYVKKKNNNNSKPSHR